MTTFIRKNDDDGSIDRSLLTRQFEMHLTDGRQRDVVALLELIAGHDPEPQADDAGDETCGPCGPVGAEPSRKQRCVTLDGLSVWVATAMHVNGDAPSSPECEAIVTDARAAILAVARDQLAEVFPDAWIGEACDVDGAVIHDELAVDHLEISFAEYRGHLEWTTLLRMATEVGVAHNERLATVGA